jgi:hypothetical protein
MSANCNSISSGYALSHLDSMTAQDACTASACRFSALPALCVGVRDSAGHCQQASLAPQYSFASSGAGAGTAARQPVDMSPNSLLSATGQAPNIFSFASTGPRYSATRGGCETLASGASTAQVYAGFVPLNSGLKPISSWGTDLNYNYSNSSLSSADYALGACGVNQGTTGWSGCS